jgi:Zn finger protein HypA/HybF involved in hydrogenase expression
MIPKDLLELERFKLLRETLKESPEFDVEEEKKLQEKDMQWYLNNGWEETKCPHCHGYFLAKNWHTPSSCPGCHWSRVD